jgi:hypothetical protein
MRAQYRTRRWAARPGGDKRAAHRLAAHRGTSTREMPRRLGAFAVALSFAVLVAQPAAASDAQMESDSKNIAVGVCTFAGGTAMMDHVLNADGSLASIQTTCLGGQADGQVCTATQSSFDCTFPFTHPPETPIQSVRPGAGSVAGAVDSSGQVALPPEVPSTVGTNGAADPAAEDPE